MPLTSAELTWLSLQIKLILTDFLFLIRIIISLCEVGPLEPITSYVNYFF